MDGSEHGLSSAFKVAIVDGILQVVEPADTCMVAIGKQGVLLWLRKVARDVSLNPFVNGCGSPDKLCLRMLWAEKLIRARCERSVSYGHAGSVPARDSRRFGNYGR